MDPKARRLSHQHTRRRDEGGYFSFHGLWAPGIRLFRELRFTLKALILSTLMLLPASALLLWQLQAQSEAALQDRKNATRQHVEVARGVLQWMHRQEQEGKLSREAAQAAARSAVSALRYDKDEYFWINDQQARVVMHPTRPELDGQDGSGLKDPNGKALFLAFAAEARLHGAGFVDYQWPRPGGQAPVDKLSYVSSFEPWGWVIGSGIYIDDLREATHARLRTSAFIMGPVMLLAFYLFVCFYRVMEGGLAETRRHLHAMTQGDLTTAPEPWGRDEAADLMLDLRAMQQSLVRMVHGVRLSSDEILNSSSEIATGAMDLSSRTEQTAANLEETAAAMEQISATVRQSTEHAQNATGIASRNAEVARHGGLVIAQMVSTMQDIQQSSHRINDIIGVIDGIAFQTNILALNAAVEAARAGEQGRGFAVVASEVRALAQRSATAAKEIKSLITASVEKVEGGTRIAENAGETMDSVVSGAVQISQLLQQIATGAAEQSQGIAQVGQAVQELDRATQQNAAMVEETAAGAAALKDEAQALSQEVASFQLPAGEPADGPLGRKPELDINVDSAIEAHRQWKVRLRKAIEHAEQLDAQTISCDDRCALGQWLYGNGGHRFGGQPGFVSLIAHHKEFHQAAGAVARSINAGRMDEARALLGANTAFSAASNAVALDLTRLKRGI